MTVGNRWTPERDEMKKVRQEDDTETESNPRRLREWWRGGIRSTAELSQPLQAVEAAMTEAAYPARDIFAVRLILEEALVNALRHGHRGDSTKVAQLHCWGSDREVMATVKDQGDGFCPDAVPDPRAQESLECPTGRGLLMMKMYASFLIFNARGNGLFFRRYRSQP
jgi:serine/threonine-protein kinase RsbW